MVNMTSPAFSIHNQTAQGSFLFTAEHTSNYIPNGYEEKEHILLQTHWAWDIGIHPLTILLSQICHSSAITACFSRLFCDANRNPEAPSLIKKQLENTKLSFNKDLSQTEREQRIQHYHRPYHQAITQSILERKKNPSPFLLLSLHSFTPIWNHKLRTMDIGVLFDRDEALAQKLATILKQNFFVSLNEPYSGKNGLIYSADRHGRTHQIPYLELEINQALLSSPERIQAIAHTLGSSLLSFKPALNANLKS